MRVLAARRRAGFWARAHPGKSGETGMDRAEKAEAVPALNATLSNAATVVIVRNLGLTVAQSTVLRQQMRDAGASFKVAKNRMARIALDRSEEHTSELQ